MRWKGSNKRFPLTINTIFGSWRKGWKVMTWRKRWVVKKAEEGTMKMKNQKSEDEEISSIIDWDKVTKIVPPFNSNSLLPFNSNSLPSCGHSDIFLKINCIITKLISISSFQNEIKRDQIKTWAKDENKSCVKRERERETSFIRRSRLSFVVSLLSLSVFYYEYSPSLSLSLFFLMNILYLSLSV